MNGLDYLPGAYRGVAPFIRNHCDERIVDAEGTAAVIMFAIGMGVFVSAIVSCLGAAQQSAPPLAQREPTRFFNYTRIILLPLLSATAISHWWLDGRERSLDSLPINCANLHGPVWYAVYLCVIGFLALAPLLMMTRGIYWFVNSATRRSAG